MKYRRSASGGLEKMRSNCPRCGSKTRNGDDTYCEECVETVLRALRVGRRVFSESINEPGMVQYYLDSAECAADILRDSYDPGTESGWSRWRG